MKQIPLMMFMLIFMAFTSNAADLIGEQDIDHYDGVTTTFTRDTSTGGTLTLNKVGGEVDALTVYGGGVVYTDATVTAAMTAIGSTNNVSLVLRPGAWAISNNLTITSNITLKILSGAVLTVASGKTLTINGPLDAGLCQVFAGSGTVTGLLKAYPEWFATNTTPGKTDMTAALQAAYVASPSVELTGTYLVTDTITLNQRFTRIGGTDLKWGTIVFNPSSSKILFRLTGCSYSNGYYGAKDVTIRNIILSSTNTVQKTGIKVEDGSDILIENINTNPATWTSSTKDCVGFHFAGRQLTTVRKCNILAEYPIRFSRNTQFASNTGIVLYNIDGDFFHLMDLTLESATIGEASSGKYNITVDDNVNLYNLTLDHISGNKGKGLFYYYNATGTQQSFSWHFSNTRFEQGDNDVNTWTVYARTAGLGGYLRDLEIDTMVADANTQGFYVDKVQGLIVRNATMLHRTLYAYRINIVQIGVFENIRWMSTALVDNGAAVFAHAVPYNSDGGYTGYIHADVNWRDESNWVRITPARGWAEYEKTYYRKDFDGVVHFKGAMKLSSGSVPSTMFTLPSGYRPSVTKVFPVAADAAFGVIVIGTDGAVRQTVGTSASSTYLDGINFRAD